MSGSRLRPAKPGVFSVAALAAVNCFRNDSVNPKITSCLRNYDIGERQVYPLWYCGKYCDKK